MTCINVKPVQCIGFMLLPLLIHEVDSRGAGSRGGRSRTRYGGGSGGGNKLGPGDAAIMFSILGVGIICVVVIVLCYKYGWWEDWDCSCCCCRKPEEPRDVWVVAPYSKPDVDNSTMPHEDTTDTRATGTKASRRVGSGYETDDFNDLRLNTLLQPSSPPAEPPPSYSPRSTAV